MLDIFKKQKFQDMMLEEFLITHGTLLDPYSVVALMLPLARELRDKHQNDELVPGLYPGRIVVSAQGCGLAGTDTDEFLSMLFAAPEVRSGGAHDSASEIFTFCALLQFMVSYAPPTSYPSASESLAAVLDKGMDDEPHARYPSMQELIFALTPFETAPAEKLLADAAKPKRRRRTPAGKSDTKGKKKKS